MAVLPEDEPLSIPLLLAAKGQERIAMMTAYDAPSAALLDAAGIDVLLVGDSAEMTVYGEPNTLTATMDAMVRHTRAVARATRRAVVVGDMPFLSYQAGVEKAVENAGRFLAEGGAAAVKVEGGRRILPAVEAILAADIPVMGHVGLTPQSYRKFGGFKVQGRETESARAIVDDAKALSDAGCFALVLECVPDSLAADITRQVPVPTIGIGAGAACDGQVLVYHDVMGLTRGHRPKFVRRYADLSTVIEQAARAFTHDVKSGAYPSREESFSGTKPPLRRVH
jgi:3-methyl-2-oxobutanoate hydroxymethyltransferase